MLYAFTLAALGGLASASPLNRRAPCDPQAPGAIGAPVPTPNTADAFRNNAEYDAIAEGAVTPQGYEQLYSNVDATNRSV